MTCKLVLFDEAHKAAEQYGRKRLLLGDSCEPNIFAYGSLFVALRPQSYPPPNVDFFDAASAKVWG
jgi:hypothetical protein